MLDKLGYAYEVDIIDSLSGVSPKPDRTTEDGHDFWNILASEMNEAEGSPVNSDNDQASHDKPSATEPDRKVSPPSDTQRRDATGESPADENVLNSTDQTEHGGTEAQQPGRERPLSSAESSSTEADDTIASDQMIVCRQETDKSHLTVAITDTLGDSPDGEELTEETRTGEASVEVFGLGVTSVPVTSQVIALPTEDGKRAEGQGLVSETTLDRPRNKPHNKEIRRHVASAVSQPSGDTDEKPANNTILNSQESTAEDGITAKLSNPTSAAPGGTGHAQTLTHDRPQRKKEPTRIQGEASGSVPVVDDKGGNDVPGNRVQVADGSNPVNLSREIVDNSGDSVLKPSETPKQDSDVVLQRTNSVGPDEPQSESSTEVTHARRMSALGEQAEHLMTIQRVAQAIRLAHERHGEIRLRLYPPELGAVKLQMRVQEGVLTARLEVETPAAREVLLDNLAGLRDRLADHHIRVENFDVALMNDGFGGQTSGWDGSSGLPQAYRPRSTASEIAPSDGHSESPKTPTTRRADNGQFDVTV